MRVPLRVRRQRQCARDSSAVMAGRVLRARAPWGTGNVWICERFRRAADDPAAGGRQRDGLLQEARPARLAGDCTAALSLRASTPLRRRPCDLCRSRVLLVCACVEASAAAAAGGRRRGVVLWAAAVTFRGGQCHGAMKAMGITIGKNGQLVVSNKTTFATSNEPSRV